MLHHEKLLCFTGGALTWGNEEGARLRRERDERMGVELRWHS